MITTTHPLRPLALLMSVLLTTACSDLLVREQQTGEAMQRSFELKPGAEQAAPPEEVSAALLPPVQLQLPGVSNGASTEQRFDVKVRRVRARDFFLSLVQDTPYSVVIDPQIGGYISLDMKNVTVPEVLETVRSVHGYDYRLSGKTIQVFPNTMSTRIFKIDYLAVKRAGQSLTTAKSGQITVASGSSGTDTGGGGANSSAITTTNDANFWVELKESLTMLLGNEEGRRISINAQTGIVMVRAMPAELRVIEEYLKTSQMILQRQVILEARILEVALNDGFQSGINWASLQQDSITAMTGGGTIFDGSGYSSLKGSGGTTGMLNISTATNALNQAAGAFGGVFGFALSTPDFTAFIELLKSQGDVQVLSSPRVSTVNNQKAVIKVGNDEFFVTNIQTTTTTGLNDNVNVSVDLEPFFSGVALDVTPQIGEAGDIVLHIHPAVSEVTEQTKNIITTQGTLTLPLAASSIRESDTVIRAANGQVVVIGGLMQNATQDNEASIPVLGDIPLLGNLFKHTKKSTRKSELVILLKPVVVDNNGRVWQNQLQRSSSSIREMSQGM